ncbi:MAG: TonB-dependent receptor [Sulfuricellaceae bacterium]
MKRLADTVPFLTQAVRRSVLAALALVIPVGAAGAAMGSGSERLLDLSMEQLLDVQVTSVAKKIQRVEDSATAVHVITQEDIRRSGMTSVPELLRMAPGLHVAQIDNGTWAIGSRGFNGRWSNKLLVLLDSRVLYTPLFSGVYWDAVDTPLEDIERIEVIRGPGATVWGANAVNGVINIITKEAAATQGGLASLTAGDALRQEVLRYGGELGESGHYRVYAKNVERYAFQRGSDAADIRTAGFRGDLRLPNDDALTFQGDAYDGNSNHTDRNVLLAPPYLVPLNFTTDLSGHNLLMRWKRAPTPDSELSLQFFWDHYSRKDMQNGEVRDTFDLEFQHRFAAGKRNEVVWGMNLRDTRDQTDAAFLASFTPANRRDRLAGLFIQDEIVLLPEKLRLTLGSKFEHNDYSGFEYQPSARLLWHIDERHSAWTAVSRAVKTPTRDDADIRINAAAFPGASRTTVLTSIFGNPNALSETLIAYEAGYRVRVTPQLSFDTALFLNDYQDIRSVETLPPFFEAMPVPHLTLGQQLANKAGAHGEGFEISGNWQPAQQWTVKGSYTQQSLHVHPDPDSSDTSALERERAFPERQWQLHVHRQATPKLSYNLSLYRFDAFSGFGADIPGYTRIDARLSYRMSNSLTLSLIGSNLAKPVHIEYLAREGPTSSEIPRTVLGTLTWRF